MNDKIDDVSDKIDDIFLDASEDLQFVRMDENQFDDYNTRTSKNKWSIHHLSKSPKRITSFNDN